MYNYIFAMIIFIIIFIKIIIGYFSLVNVLNFDLIILLISIILFISLRKN
jgi:hypothetical protein